MIKGMGHWGEFRGETKSFEYLHIQCAKAHISHELERSHRQEVQIGDKETHGSLK